MSNKARRDSNSDIINSVSDAPVERKDAYLKRIAKEDKTNKKVYKKSGAHITLDGYKVIIKYYNATGTAYSKYWFNGKRYAQKLAEIKKNKGWEVDGKFLELK